MAVQTVVCLGLLIVRRGRQPARRRRWCVRSPAAYAVGALVGAACTCSWASREPALAAAARAASGGADGLLASSGGDGAWPCWPDATWSELAPDVVALGARRRRGQLTWACVYGCVQALSGPPELPLAQARAQDAASVEEVEVAVTMSTARARAPPGALARPGGARPSRPQRLSRGAAVAAPPLASPALAWSAVALGVVVWRTTGGGGRRCPSAVTPLVAGIDRGRLVPVLRPNEALVALARGILVLRAIVRRYRLGWRPRIRLTGSRGPWWLMAPGELGAAHGLHGAARPLGRADDISYALVLWKYLGVYALVRLTVRTERRYGWCLWASLPPPRVVGAIGFLQALDLLGVRELLVGVLRAVRLRRRTGAAAGRLDAGAAGGDRRPDDPQPRDRRRPAGGGPRHRLAARSSVRVCVHRGSFAAAEFSSALGLARRGAS